MAPPGKQGIQGEPGPAATINGVNTLTITAGDNVTLKQEGSALEIGAVVPGKNLLLNWDFRNPVNRNGKTEYTMVGYTIDRWRLNLSTYNAYTMILSPEGYVELHQNINDTSSIIEQHVKSDASMLGKTVTFSVLTADMGCISKTVTLTTTPSYVYFVAGSSTNGYASIQFVSDQNTIRFIIGSGNGTRKIVAAKLELGTQQTLARQDADGNWVLNDSPDYDLQYALCSLYSPSTGAWVGNQHSNPNLLDNWYFVDPVNQRGQTEYESGIGIDRWHGKGVQLKNGYLHVEGPMYQTIEADVAKFYYGKRITLSILLADGSLYSGSNVVPSTVTSSNQWCHCCNVTNGQALGFYVLAGGSMQIFRINSDTATAGLDVVAVKTELGSVQTLAHQDADGTWVLNDPPPNKALELAKCQRYMYVIEAGNYWPAFSGYVTGGLLTTRVGLNLPTKMRTVPAIKMDGLSLTVRTITGYSENASNETPGAPNTCVAHSTDFQNCVLDFVWDSAVGSNNNTPCAVELRTGKIILDANES